MSKNKLSPMMEHYKGLKEKYPDAILLYRLGDFYEMFFEDAVEASKILDLTLTGRDCGLEKRAPMCGVPHHAADNYVARLINAGKKVAVCEQLSQPGDQKGMVKRDVIRVITPGTVTEEEMLDKSKNSYLVSIINLNDRFSMAWIDITTGEFNVREFEKSKDALDVEDFLLTLSPKEIIANSAMADTASDFSSVKTSKMVKVMPYYDYSFDFDLAKKTLLKQMSAYDLSALGLEGKKLAVSAAGGLLDYINNTQKRSLSHINSIKYVRTSSYMYLDYNTKRNLELFETMTERKKYGSLYWVIDRTQTAMGARLLRNWINSPLQTIDEIQKRQSAVQEIVKNNKLREMTGCLLANIRDIERIVTKISYFSIMPRDCLALKESIKQIVPIKKLLSLAKSDKLKSINEKLEILDDLEKTIERAIVEDAPATLKDGNYIKKGYDEQLDTLRALQHSAKRLLLEFELKQKNITGIGNLKVGFNRIFGYYIEVPKSAKNATIPMEYRRKQTVASGERYTTEELEKLQDDIIGAGEKSLKMESELFLRLRDYMSMYIIKLQKNAYLIAYLDSLYSLSMAAVENNFAPPKLNNKNIIKITDGFHPIVSKLLKANEFVKNDTLLNDKDTTMMIITGPNMAGKSTYIRQVALITLLAHIGSFVPAKSADICITDRIFTRVGASDNLVYGQSTFMVEMLEVANIINNATSKSLLILDEIGRGTSTLDGLSIAWAIIEYIAMKIKAKSLFATHYHELSEIESLLDGIRNYRILVHENQKQIAFIYKIARGSANRSYGIEVAALAGIRKEITKRATDIMNVLAKTHQLSGNLQEKLSSKQSETTVAGSQIALFEEDENIKEIKKMLCDLDINRCSPIEALTILNDLKKLIKKVK